MSFTESGLNRGQKLHDADAHDVHSSQHEERVAEIVARCGNIIFTRFGLSPPWGLRDAARHWLALSPDEIARIVVGHLDLHLGGYHSGSGDELFHVLERAIRQAIEAKSPVPERQPERPQRPRNRVVTLPNPGRLPDVYLEGAAAHLVSAPVSNVERPSGLQGYETGGVSIGDDEGGA